eukprot:snap_masked-scaffold_18-processed-gene-3.28-mRNA-1 protein AED:1.00 eAED:1.00 QI:0/-1/0/0/-1/1/1/0/535
MKTNVKNLVKLSSKAVLAFVLYNVVKLYLRWKRSVRLLKNLAKKSDKIAFADELGSTPLAMAQNMLDKRPCIHHYRLSLFEKYTKGFSNRVKTFGACGILLNYNPILFTVDPVLIKHVFRDQVNTYLKMDFGFEMGFGKSIQTAQHGPFADDGGIFFSFQRKTASKLFTKKNLHGFANTSISKHLVNIHNAVSQLAVDGMTKEFPLKNYIFEFTFQVMSEVGFGKVYANREDTKQYLKAFKDFFDLLPNTLENPLWKIPLSQYWVPSKVEFMKNKKILDTLCYEMVDDRMKSDNKTEADDLLALFIQASRGSEYCSREIMKNFALLFLSAGTDTSSLSLQYMVLYLCRDRELQEKLRNLVLEFSSFDPITKEMKIDLDKMKACKFLDAFIFETMRLHSVVGFNGRTSAKADVLPDGSVVPKGTTVIYDAFSIAHDPSVYENPREFLPERWMSDDRVPESFDDSKYIVFAAGKRICMGKDLALQEMKMFVSYFLNAFEISLSEKEKKILATQEFHYGVGQFHDYRNDLLINLKLRH